MKHSFTVFTFLLLANTYAFTPLAALHQSGRKSTESGALSRSEFLNALAVVIAAPSVASAKEVDPSVKGTKEDPAYQSCLSTCLYECTKPKGEETKLRKECLPECKQKCATTKAQLMLGTPK
jgi:hypothetical protein